jgi:hypothetical protein
MHDGRPITPHKSASVGRFQRGARIWATTDGISGGQSVPQMADCLAPCPSDRGATGNEESLAGDPARLGGEKNWEFKRGEGKLKVM